MRDVTNPHRSSHPKSAPSRQFTYRLFGADDVLFYVGVTADWGARSKGHARDKPWWSEIVRVDIEEFASRAEAEYAEAVAIATEHPRYNIQRPGPAEIRKLGERANRLSADHTTRELLDALDRIAGLEAMLLNETGRARGVLQREVAQTRLADIGEGYRQDIDRFMVEFDMAWNAPVTVAELGEVRAERLAVLWQRDRDSLLTMLEDARVQLIDQQHMREVRQEETLELRRELAIAESEVDALRAELATVVPPSWWPSEPRFGSLDLFVERFLLPNWVHPNGVPVRWCSTWWEHAEAILRFEALWESFEVMRLQPAPAFSTWMTAHLDVQMRALTAAEGVFFGCDATRGCHETRAPWPSATPPEGMFGSVAAAQIHRWS